MFSTKRSKASSSNSDQFLSSSADVIASDVDILTLILNRLPLKSLLKFKSVSKHWLSLITDPTFRPKHNNSTTISGLFVRRRRSYDFINLTPNPSRAPFRSLTFVHDNKYGIKILQSCNALLLCSSSSAVNATDTIYYIYNPTTKHYTVLPPRNNNNTFGITLAFEPSKSPHYKVICVTKYDPDLPDHYQIEIYTPNTGPWKRFGRPFIAPYHVQFKDGVYWNGAIHWLSVNEDSLLCFDIEREEIKDIRKPIINEEDVRPCRYLGESGGHLYLVEVYDSYSLEFEVYEMQRDYSAWFVKYKADLNPVSETFPEMTRGYIDPIDLHYYAFSILGIVHEETDEEGSFMVLHLPNIAIRYNFKDNSFRKIHDFAQLGSRLGSVRANHNNNSLEFECFDAYQFIESFAFV